MIFDHYFKIREWFPIFQSLDHLSKKKMIVCIRFPDLLLEYNDDTIYKKIGNIIERTIKVDLTTSHISRENLFKFCGEVGISQPSSLNYFIR